MYSSMADVWGIYWRWEEILDLLALWGRRRWKMPWGPRTSTSSPLSRWPQAWLPTATKGPPGSTVPRQNGSRWSTSRLSKTIPSQGMSQWPGHSMRSCTRSRKGMQAPSPTEQSTVFAWDTASSPQIAKMEQATRDSWQVPSLSRH